MATRQPDAAGVHRDPQVYVGDDVPPAPARVEPAMETLLAWEPADPVDAIKWHVAFEQIHPFADGNGRIGRLLDAWQCTQLLGVEPIIWRATDREGYYDLFQSHVDIDSAASAP